MKTSNLTTWIEVLKAILHTNLSPEIDTAGIVQTETLPLLSLKPTLVIFTQRAPRGKRRK
jgi:hypothetical protein